MLEQRIASFADMSDEDSTTTGAQDSSQAWLKHSDLKEALEAGDPAEQLNALLARPNTVKELDIPIGMVIDILVRSLAAGESSLQLCANILHLQATLLDEIMMDLQK